MSFSELSMTSSMVLNSPIILLIAGFLCLFGIVFIFQLLRKSLLSFEKLPLNSPGMLENQAGNANIGSSKFRSLLLQTIAVPLVTCTILVVTFLYQANNILSLNAWVDHTDEVLLKTSAVHGIILETESALRGYILTFEDQFLQQYKESKLKTTPMVDDLSTMVQDNDRQSKKLRDLKQAFTEWGTSAEAARKIRESGQTPSKNDVIQRRATMDKVKTTLDDFETTEFALRKERIIAVRENVNFSVVLIITASILAGVFLALSGGHQLRKLSGSYNQILSDLDRFNQSLDAKVQDRTLELTAINKELEAFCYSVSHDLRAPLRGIDGFSQILIEEYRSNIDEAGVKYLNYIRQGVQKMGVLIDDLLNLSRLTRIEINFKEFDMVPMVKELVEALKATDPSRKVEFKTVNSAVVNADPGLIRVALENLLSNSFKYSSKKEISKLEFGTTETDHGRTYFVRDNGVGFDMKYYGKLFNVFQRLHDNAIYKGTGIGLATVKRVLARHGGEIWAESIPDQETTFFFTIKRKA